MVARILGVLALSTVFFPSVVNAEQPPNLYGVAHLRNDSRAKATTYFKWGNDPWRKTVIGRGESIAFYYPYDGTSQKSPSLFIRIDVDTDGVRWVEHILSRGASPDDNSIRYGHKFVIRQTPGTDHRAIVSVDGRGTVTVTDKSSTKPNVN